MGTVELKQTEMPGKFFEYATICLSGGYILDEENKTSVIACIDILEKNERGLMVIGNPGSGKTLIFEVAQRITLPGSPLSFSKISVLDVVLQFNNKEIGHNVFRKWNNVNVFFDDLGTEDKGYLFGEKVEVFEKFIQFRYDLFRGRGIKTHFTSNLSGDDLKKRYGARCYSRLREMCDVIMLGSSATYSDRRRLRNFIGLPQVKHLKILSEDEKYIHRVYDQMKSEGKNKPPVEYKGLGERIKEQFKTRNIL